jgi:hypothetical protein
MTSEDRVILKIEKTFFCAGYLAAIGDISTGLEYGPVDSAALLRALDRFAEFQKNESQLIADYSGG